MKFLVHFVQLHADFRIQESIAKLYGMDIKCLEYSNSSPFLIIELQSIDNAIKLAQRSILIRNISELWGVAADYTEIVQVIQNCNLSNLPQYYHESFKFHVDSYGCTMSIEDRIAHINSLAFLGYAGKIDLVNPKNTFVYYLEYEEGLDSKRKENPPPKRIFMGRLLAESCRPLIHQYDLKKRSYIGTTSMDAELSLISANMALARRGSFVFDPFVGTGSFLFACSQFGATTFGADIDGRQIRGSQNNGLDANVAQYKLNNLVLGSLVCDIANHPWVGRPLFDAIVCDPPYGVRAGAKTIAPLGNGEQALPVFKENGEKRYPNMVAYELSNILSDLVYFASEYLVLGGRLVFWMPTLNEQYQETDIPIVENLKLIANSEQAFGKWSRRLITLEKVSEFKNIKPIAANLDSGHAKFRHKYFNQTTL